MIIIITTINRRCDYIYICANKFQKNLEKKPYHFDDMLSISSSTRFYDVVDPESIVRTSGFHRVFIGAGCYGILDTLLEFSNVQRKKRQFHPLLNQPNRRLLFQYGFYTCPTFSLTSKMFILIQLIFHFGSQICQPGLLGSMTLIQKVQIRCHSCH